MSSRYNYDSFTYNIASLVRSLGYPVEVRRNDEITPEQAGEYPRVIVSPGPGLPCESGILPRIFGSLRPLQEHSRDLPGRAGHRGTFRSAAAQSGECLSRRGHPVRVVAPDPIFEGLGEEFLAGRYHSWVVDEEGFPAELEVTARDPMGQVMALRHRRYDVRGVQFHPESVLTPKGGLILKNWLEKYPAGK